MNSDNEDHYVPAKLSRTDSNRPRRKSNAADFIDPEPREDEDVDVQEEEEPAAPLKYPAKSSSKTKKKLQTDGPPPRKKIRNVVVSDSETDGYLEADEISEEEDVDDDYQSAEDDKPKGKLKTPAARGSKRKAVASSRSAAEQKPSFESIPTIKKIKLSLKVHEPSIGSAGAPSADPSSKGSPSTLKPDSPAPQPKKIKLPTIKKIPKPGSAGTSTPTASQAPKPKQALEVGISTKLADIRKSQTSTFDLDLSNKSVYQELFKTVSELYSVMYPLFTMFRVLMEDCFDLV